MLLFATIRVAEPWTTGAIVAMVVMVLAVLGLVLWLIQRS